LAAVGLRRGRRPEDDLGADRTPRPGNLRPPLRQVLPDTCDGLAFQRLSCPVLCTGDLDRAVRTERMGGASERSKGERGGRGVGAGVGPWR